MIDSSVFGFLIEYVNLESFRGISHKDKSMLIFLSFFSKIYIAGWIIREQSVLTENKIDSTKWLGLNFFQPFSKVMKQVYQHHYDPSYELGCTLQPTQLVSFQDSNYGYKW